MNEEFTKRIVALRGDKGKRWLDELPQLIKQYEKKWDIQTLPPYQLSYNYVAPAASSDSRHVVLKISFPDNHEFTSELEALKFYCGDGSIRIVKEDRENGAVLLEKAEPGIRLKEITNDRKQISFASDILKKLHKPVPTNYSFMFPTIADWAKAFARHKETFANQSDPIPQWMFEKAEQIFREYIQENKEQVLLHGDLHSDNILSSERGWLAIDPKGVIGEREFELGTYLRNPLYDYPKGSNYKKLEINRILQFSEELGFEKERILNWSFANAVISLIWFLEDEKYFKEIYIRNAELLHEITI